jgi:hypothetical protein
MRSYEETLLLCISLGLICLGVVTYDALQRNGKTQLRSKENWVSLVLIDREREIDLLSHSTRQKANLNTATDHSFGNGTRCRRVRTVCSIPARARAVYAPREKPNKPRKGTCTR